MENQLILRMIEKQLTLNEMANFLWQSPRRIYQEINRMKNEGYFIAPNYFDDGEVKFAQIDRATSHTIKIGLTNDDFFKALIVSDMHIGNECENLDYIYKAYDYARDNDIHIILNCGDLIDGNFSRGGQIVTDIDKQIERVLTYYPYDRTILNIICLGNHDYSSVECGFNMEDALLLRPDLVSAGYGISLINIGKDQFVMKHGTSGLFGCIPNKLILKGHSHKAGVKINSNNYILNIPPLSDLCFAHQENPGMIDMRLSLSNGYIHTGYFKHLSVKDKIGVFNDICLEFNFNHEIVDEKKLIIKWLIFSTFTSPWVG